MSAASAISAAVDKLGRDLDEVVAGITSLCTDEENRKTAFMELQKKVLRLDATREATDFR